MSAFVSFAQFAVAATLVQVSHVEFDPLASSLDVRVSWVEFDPAAAVTTYEGVSRRKSPPQDDEDREIMMIITAALPIIAQGAKNGISNH